MSVTFVNFEVGLGDLVNKLGILLSNIRVGPNINKVKIIRALVRHCMLAFPEYNVVVSLVPLLFSNDEDREFASVELEGVRRRTRMKKTYRFDVSIFKSGVVTNLQNLKDSKDWGKFQFRQFWLKISTVTIIIGYNGHITEVYGTEDNVFKFEEKGDLFDDENIYPIKENNFRAIKEQETQNFVNKHIKSENDLENFIKICEKKLSNQSSRTSST